MSRANLNRRGWSGPIYREACGYDTETTSHIFLHCPVRSAIWDFLLLNANYQLNRINIPEIFSFFHLLKFNINWRGWNTLVLAFWSFWLSRNDLIFRNQGRNISSTFHQILHLTSCWTENLATGQGSTNSPMAQTIRQMQQAWDHRHPTQDTIYASCW